jgi:hypothetical protein
LRRSAALERAAVVTAEDHLICDISGSAEAEVVEVFVSVVVADMLQAWDWDEFRRRKVRGVVGLVRFVRFLNWYRDLAAIDWNLRTRYREAMIYRRTVDLEKVV